MWGGVATFESPLFLKVKGAKIRSLFLGENAFVDDIYET